MTSQSALVNQFCRLYSVLLYAYPRGFRREYGRHIEQVFRDRCRELAARTSGVLPVLRFAGLLIADFVATAVREHASAIWAAGRRPIRRGPVSEWAATILLYLFATTTLVQAYVVPTGSMEGTIRVGDHMLVDRMAYSKPAPGKGIVPYREIRRGDVVVFLYPEDIRQTYVKRVIGLPGDRIRLENKQVIRNGRRLIEPYTQHISPAIDPNRDNFPQSADFYTTPRGCNMFDHQVDHGEVVVPPNSLFVLGDNRDNSLDSRYWGFVPRDHVVGKPLVVYWSYDAPTAELEEWNVHHLLDVAQHFFTRTRWERTFLVPRSQPARELGGTH